jgi:hypothetical protein
MTAVNVYEGKFDEEIFTKLVLCIGQLMINVDLSTKVDNVV